MGEIFEAGTTFACTTGNRKSVRRTIFFGARAFLALT
jgi:hypothetical protein